MYAGVETNLKLPGAILCWVEGPHEDGMSFDQKRSFGQQFTNKRPTATCAAFKMQGTPAACSEINNVNPGFIEYDT